MSEFLQPENQRIQTSQDKGHVWLEKIAAPYDKDSTLAANSQRQSRFSFRVTDARRLRSRGPGIPAMILFCLSILGLVHAQNITEAPLAAPVSTTMPVVPPTTLPTTAPFLPTMAPTNISVGPTTMAPTLSPSKSSMPSAVPSESPTALPSFTSPIVEKENFRQEFVVIKSEDFFFNETEQETLQEIYQSYTNRFFTNVSLQDRIVTVCDVTEQSSLPIDEEQVNSVDFFCEYTSQHVDVSNFTTDFATYVNNNLRQLINDMRAAGIPLDGRVLRANEVIGRTVLSPAPTASLFPSAMPSPAPSVSPMPSELPSNMPSSSPTVMTLRPTPATPPTNPPESEDSGGLGGGAVGGIIAAVGLAFAGGIVLLYLRHAKKRDERVRSRSRPPGRVPGQESAGDDLTDDDTGGNAILSPTESIQSNKSMLSDGKQDDHGSVHEPDDTHLLQDEFDEYKDQNVENFRREVEGKVANAEGIVSAAVTNAIMDQTHVEISELLWGCTENPSGADIEASALCEVTEWLKRNGTADSERKRAFLQDILNKTVTSVRYGVLRAADASRTVHESAAILGLPLARDLPGNTVIISGMRKTTSAGDMQKALQEFGDVECSAVASGRRGFGLLRYTRAGSATRAFNRYTSGEIVILDVSIQMKVLKGDGVLDGR